jgi:hypothetical protein
MIKVSNTEYIVSLVVPLLEGVHGDTANDHVGNTSMVRDPIGLIWSIIARGLVRCQRHGNITQHRVGFVWSTTFQLTDLGQVYGHVGYKGRDIGRHGRCPGYARFFSPDATTHTHESSDLNQPPSGRWIGDDSPALSE